MSKNRKKRTQPTQAQAAAGSETPLDLLGTATVTEIEAKDGKPKQRRFKIVAYTGEPLVSQYAYGWEYPVVVDMAGIKTPRDSGVVPILEGHQQNRGAIVGQSETAGVVNGEYVLEGPMIEHTEASKDIIDLADKGFSWQASVGARSRKKDFIAEGNTGEANGRKYDGPCWISRETLLRETSFVVIGDDSNSNAVVASQLRGSPMKFSEYCKANGFDEGSLTADQKKCLKAAHKKMYAADDDEEDDADADGDGDDDPKDKKKKATEAAATLDIAASAQGGDGAREAFSAADYRKQVAAEENRIRQIRACTDPDPTLETEIKVKGKTKSVNIREYAIRAGWDADKTTMTFQLAEIRASRAGGGRIEVPNTWFSPSTPQLSEAIVEAAVMQAGGCQLDDEDFYKKYQVSSIFKRRAQREVKARYTDEVQQRAHDLYRGRIGLQQVLIAGAQMNHKRVREVIRSDGDIETVLRSCNWNRTDPDQIEAAGASTASIANVLANVLNKFLLMGYLFVESTWRDVCAVRPVKDFKPTKSINLFGDFVYKELNQDGEIEHATLQDQAFANQANTYARILEISRTYIINDDLNALTTTPQLMARGSGLKMNDLFWSTFLVPGNDDGGSTAFWAATHTITGEQGNSNYISGGTTNLSSASLQSASQTFDKQVDPKGFPIGVDAKILLFPPELKVPAKELIQAQYLVYGGASANKQPNTNIWQGDFRPAMSRYLSNPNYTGNSPTAWYLLAEPGILPVIEAAFLNGQETPTVQTAQANFDRLGISVRGFFDVGVNMQNFRGGVKSNGA